jgi:hypothetical protein
MMIAVGALITERPPHNAVREAFPHTAPAKPALLSLGRRMAAKLNQSGLVRVQRQRELLQPLDPMRAL